jgi:hypothetical protein
MPRDRNHYTIQGMTTGRFTTGTGITHATPAVHPYLSESDQQFLLRVLHAGLKNGAAILDTSYVLVVDPGASAEKVAEIRNLLEDKSLGSAAVASLAGVPKKTVKMLMRNNAKVLPEVTRKLGEVLLAISLGAKPIPVPQALRLITQLRAIWGCSKLDLLKPAGGNMFAGTYPVGGVRWDFKSKLEAKYAAWAAARPGNIVEVQCSKFVFGPDGEWQPDMAVMPGQDNPYWVSVQPREGPKQEKLRQLLKQYYPDCQVDFVCQEWFDRGLWRPYFDPKLWEPANCS